MLLRDFLFFLSELIYIRANVISKRLFSTCLTKITRDPNHNFGRLHSHSLEDWDLADANYLVSRTEIYINNNNVKKGKMEWPISRDNEKRTTHQMVKE